MERSRGSGTRRVILIVLDGVGIGEAPDAAEYGDEGSNSLVNTAAAVGGLNLPHLGRLGLGNITDIPGVPPEAVPLGMFGKMRERSRGKDTTTGHWEIAGIIMDKPFPTYPDGFPDEIIAAFRERTGRGVLANKPASGTVVIEEFGPAHLATGDLIVYTSADSVFQIAAHVEVVPEEELYAICRIARELLQGEHAVSRVIARPFAGEPGSFWRTAGRRDFSLPPPEETLLDAAVDAGLSVWAVGKIADIFAGRGISHSFPTGSNAEGVARTLQLVREAEGSGIIFTNLVETDAVYGHRNDPHGYAAALSEFDAALPALLDLMRPTDLLIITADHGVDPTTGGTDHTREYVPLLVYGGPSVPGSNLGVRDTFADVAASVRAYLGLPAPRVGTSFLETPRAGDGQRGE